MNEPSERIAYEDEDEVTLQDQVPGPWPHRGELEVLGLSSGS